MQKCLIIHKLALFLFLVYNKNTNRQKFVFYFIKFYGRNSTMFIGSDENKVKKRFRKSNIVNLNIHKDKKRSTKYECFSSKLWKFFLKVPVN